MSTVAVFTAVVLCSLLLQTAVVWLCARWLKAGRGTLLRAAMAVLLIFAGHLAFLLWNLARRPEEATWGGELAGLVAVLLVVTFVFVWLLRMTFRRAAALTGLFVVLANVPLLAGGLLLLRPYVVEAFLVPSGAMSPTIQGWHVTTSCPSCGGPLSVPRLPGERRTTHVYGICEKCLNSVPVGDVKGQPQTPDRIVANKLLSPARWDIIVYEPPDAPGERFCTRLVGLPGEAVFIEDGSVWISGQKHEAPPGLAGLKYMPRQGRLANEVTRDSPMRLGPEECFVLGDFSQIAADSRYVGPIPWPNIRGVVTLIYWPPSRARVFR